MSRQHYKVIIELHVKVVFLQLSGLLARKKDGKMAYKLVMLSQDSSLQVIHKNGKNFFFFFYSV